MRKGWPCPQGMKASWPLNARTRAAVKVSNENKEKSRVSKARYCTKSKKEVSGDLFVGSCHTCLTATIKVSKFNAVLYTDPTLCEGKGLVNSDAFIGCVGGVVSYIASAIACIAIGTFKFLSLAQGS